MSKVEEFLNSGVNKSECKRAIKHLENFLGEIWGEFGGSLARS